MKRFSSKAMDGGAPSAPGTVQTNAVQVTDEKVSAALVRGMLDALTIAPIDPATGEKHAVEITDEKVSAALVRGMVDGLSIAPPGEREVSR